MRTVDPARVLDRLRQRYGDDAIQRAILEVVVEEQEATIAEMVEQSGKQETP